MRRNLGFERDESCKQLVKESREPIAPQPDQDTLKLEIVGWEEERNQKSDSVNWRFTIEDALIKLKRLYPSIQT